MRQSICLLLIAVAASCFAQTSDNNDAIKEITKFQKDLNEEFRNPDKSPLEKKERKKFRKHDFFTIDLDYRVDAVLTVASTSDFFGMKTSTERLPEYRVYGTVDFTLKGKHFQLPVYQSKDLMKRLEYKDFLFFPFTDLTNGVTTYGGGRYIELKIPGPDHKITIDFNQAYNPFCAYSGKYSCPIVPQENHIDIEVNAGVRYLGKTHH